MNSYKILVKFPTRNRPVRFFETLDLYISKANNINNIIFLITCDNDDLTMNNSKIHDRLKDYQVKYNLQFFFENNTSKIEAINASMDKVIDWDILLLASDDMIPVVEGYDDIIRNDMLTFHSNLDGILWYSDGNQNITNTLCILGKNYYERFNYIYHPSYISLFCDNEYTEVAMFLGKYYKTDQVIIKHTHPAFGHKQYDDLYIKNEAYYNIDNDNFEKRKKGKFDLYKILPLFSILTTGIPSRMDMLKKLCNKIQEQISKNNLVGKVEHIILIDNKIQTIGRKRNNLLQNSLGHFVAFLDDDDDISDDYLSSIIDAITQYPDVDVITFKQKCFINNNPASTVIFGLQNNNEPYVPGQTFLRKPFHMCAWNRDIALSCNVPYHSYIEDSAWLSQLWKKASKDFFIDKILHTYVYKDDVTTFQSNIFVKQL